jgi:choline dehydrogenase-like flavoprotein
VSSDISQRPDAIIVGSGAGGATAARVLTSRGWRVTVMEKGGPANSEDFLPYDELHFNAHKTLIPNARKFDPTTSTVVSDDPMVYAGKDEKQTILSERWWEVTMVGGSTMIWDANFPRYTPEDFDFPSYNEDTPTDQGVNMVKWPWSYEEFLPYFERAEWEWGVAGDARQSPEWMREGYQYPMPPLKAHASSDFLFQIFNKSGLQPYFGARAINSETFDGRPACSFCGYNQFFGCAVNSRANASNTMLRRALATGRCDLRLNHCVTRLSHENGKVTGVFYKTEPGGQEIFMGADRVFVSIQTIQSARLFLLSEIPDPNKLVGKYLTYHPKGDLHLTFKGRRVWDDGPAYQPRTAIGSLQLRGMYSYKNTKTGRKAKGGKFSVYDPYTCTTPIRLIKAASMGRDEKSVWGSRLVDYVQELRSQGGVSFSFTGDAISVEQNRVELDPNIKDPWGLPVAKTFYKHPQWDLELSNYALTRMAEIMSDAGGEIRKFEPQIDANPGYGHVHGALRAGLNPDSSVLDANCQSHTVKGLYVLDAAFMPTAGASNPSLTLIANAFRVCENIPL